MYKQPEWKSYHLRLQYKSMVIFPGFKKIMIFFTLLKNMSSLK